MRRWVMDVRAYRVAELSPEELQAVGGGETLWYYVGYGIGYFVGMFAAAPLDGYLGCTA